MKTQGNDNVKHLTIKAAMATEFFKATLSNNEAIDAVMEICPGDAMAANRLMARGAVKHAEFLIAALNE